MDLHKIKALIDLLAESPLASLEVIEGDERVKLVKSKRRGRRHDTRPAGDHADEASTAPVPTAPAGDPAFKVEPTSAASPHLILAPMFGVVHLTPAPGEAPFVQAGDAVDEGQVLCAIEAMKMFNAIECERSGTILEILVAPGSEVESGQALFRIG